MHTIEQVLDLGAIRAEIADLGEEVAAPDLWDDQANAQRVTSRLSLLNSEIDRFTELNSRVEDLALLVEMGQEEGDAESLAESEAELVRVKKAVEALEVRTLLNGEYDEREALVSIRSGAGGVDAADFAEMLMRMYMRWAEQHKYPVEVFDTSYAEEAGLKSATFAIHAPYAYGTLSVEAGTHRLVRISPFDNQGRRQTSFAAVEVVPVLEQTDEIDIPDEDIRVDVYRSGGPGGQSVNTTDSAVRLTHLPTGTVVSCQNEKSQLQNKASAMVVLKAKLLALKKAEEKAHLDGMRGDVKAEWGDQMRNYVLNPYQMVKDLRTGHEVGNTAGGLRRRHRRLHRGRHPLAPRRREGRRELVGSPTSDADAPRAGPLAQLGGVHGGIGRRQLAGEPGVAEQAAVRRSGAALAGAGETDRRCAVRRGGEASQPAVRLASRTSISARSASTGGANTQARASLPSPADHTRRTRGRRR